MRATEEKDIKNLSFSTLLSSPSVESLSYIPHGIFFPPTVAPSHFSS